jgi:hypothetical protein
MFQQQKHNQKNIQEKKSFFVEKWKKKSPKIFFPGFEIYFQPF